MASEEEICCTSLLTAPPSFVLPLVNIREVVHKMTKNGCIVNAVQLYKWNNINLLYEVHGAEFFLKSKHLFFHSDYIPFMEPKGLLPYSQGPATCYYSEPKESSPNLHPISERSRLLLSSLLLLDIPSFFPSGS
jgi:hypothetical protein